MGYKSPHIYSIYFTGATYSPSDTEVDYVGTIYGLPIGSGWGNTAYGTIPLAGRIQRAVVQHHSSTAAGTNEDISVYIRINNTTDHLIQTVGVAATQRNFVNYNLNIPVVAGDTIELKVVCPTWATNPTGVRMAGEVYIECE